LNFDLLNQHLTTWIRGNVDTESERDEASQTTPIFDTELAFTIANQQPDLAIEMLDLFMQSLDRDRAKLNQAIADNNMELMRDVVHRLNGASQFCGIPRVQAAICRLESLIKTDAANDLPIVLHQVQQELNALEQWYSQTPNPLLEFPRTSLRQLS
jgi:two-component system, NarL family, sensor histidine kinase BarA